MNHTIGYPLFLTPILPPDAKWWDLALVPETAEVLEFQVQPELKP